MRRRRTRGTVSTIVAAVDPAASLRIWDRFQARLMAWLILLAALISLVAGAIYHNRQVKYVKAEQAKRGKTLISNLAGQSELGVYAEESSFLTPAARRAFLEEDVSFVVIYNRRGRELIRLVKPGVRANTAIDQELLKEMLRDTSGRPKAIPTPEYIDLLAPIITLAQDAEGALFGDTNDRSLGIGITRIGLSRRPAQEKLNDVLNWAVYLSLISLAMGIILASFLARRISQPILSLTKGAEEIRRGQYGYQLDLKRNDELGLLADSFNRMSDRLRGTVDSLAHLNRNLEAEVDRRTDALRTLAKRLEEQNLELQRQRDQLEEGNRLKSEFLANVSHELRTPLNAVLGYTELLGEEVYGPVTDKQQQTLKSVAENAENLLQLINEILDLSKVEAGKMTVRWSEVDVAELVRDIVKGCEPLVRNKSFDVRIKCEEGLSTITTDAVKIRQILVNLISNSIKFTNEGWVQVTARPSGDGGAEIEVHDTGIGIAEQDLGLIFNEFRQLDGTSTRKQGGTGLGLAISKKLAILIGGEIHVQSEPGHGSRFTLVLPKNRPPRSSSSGPILRIDKSGEYHVI